MTTALRPGTDVPVAPIPAATGAAARLRAWLGDVVALTGRNLLHVRREPAQLSDATIQPVLFTLLFVELFGSAMVIPGGGSYKDFAIGGMVSNTIRKAST